MPRAQMLALAARLETRGSLSPRGRCMWLHVPTVFFLSLTMNLPRQDSLSAQPAKPSCSSRCCLNWKELRESLSSRLDEAEAGSLSKFWHGRKQLLQCVYIVGELFR